MSNIRNKKLKVGITLGDINGIGPELVIKTFADDYLKEMCIPILYGSSKVINIYRKRMGLDHFRYTVIPGPSDARSRKLNLIECLSGIDSIEPGNATQDGAKAAIKCLDQAIADAQHGSIDLLVTLPVDKASIQKEKADFRGHTEMLGEAFNAKNNLMMMVGEEMKVGLVTNHLPIQEVAEALSVEKIGVRLKQMQLALQNDFNISKPKIAVLGLNPHAGDSGLLGKEEKDIIEPAIAKAKREGMLVVGPFAADGFFGGGMYRKFDGILAMYHDQGLIPFKLSAGFRGVNYTAGMSIIRTSPDHGVAFDIAGRGIANPESFRQAIYRGCDNWYNRHENEELKANALRMK